MTFTRRRVASATVAVSMLNTTVLLAALTVISIVVPPDPLAQATATIGIVVLTGTLLGRRLSASVPLCQRLVIDIGLGFLCVVGVGALFGYLLPKVGIAHPLSRGPLLVIWAILLVAIAASSELRHDDHVRKAFCGMRRRDVAWAAVLSLPPILALVGVDRIDVAAQPQFAIFVGVIVVALVACAILLPTTRYGPPRLLLLVSAIVTAAWQQPFLGGWLSGSDIQHEYYVASLAVQQAAFPLHYSGDPYGGMLSLTVWPAMLHAITGMSLRDVLGLPPSILLALCVAVTWCTLRERLGPRLSAVLCTLFIVGSEPMLRTLPSETRQCYALFFFALLVMAVTSRRISNRTAQLVAAAAGVGVAVTHYSSAYLTAGAVVIGCVLTLALRTEKGARVLTVPVTAVIVGAAGIWGGFIAKTGSSLSELASSIRADGFNLLPSGGSVFTRWLKAASTSQLVNAKVIKAQDEHLRTTKYGFMEVTSRAAHVPFVNLAAPTAKAVPAIGAFLSVSGPLIAELIVVAAFASVVCILWRTRVDRTLAALLGLAVFGLVASALSRLSQTIAVDFSPPRVQVQMYLIFVVTLGVAIEWSVSTSRSKPLRVWIDRHLQVCVAVGAVVACLALSTALQLDNLVEAKAQLPAEYSAVGEQSQRIPTPQDLLAARWVAANRTPGDLVQADLFAQLALWNFGYATRHDFVASVDPIIIDNRSWVFADATNVRIGTARGGDNAEEGVFNFPLAYLASTRSILYVSPTDTVFGKEHL